MSKGKIHEFDPVIYPMRLWVSILPDFKTVDDMFYFLGDKDDIVDDAEDEFNGHDHAMATTFAVANKESGWRGCLVVIWTRSQCGTGVCAHEATHVVDWLDERLGLGGHSFNDGEPRAYLVQWVANCISDVLYGRVK